MQAAIAGCAVFSAAAESAARQASGPGSFSVAFLDHLRSIGES
jgi:hydroxyethylthiazole kinase-like sugar kinase family protein